MHPTVCFHHLTCEGKTQLLSHMYSHEKMQLRCWRKLIIWPLGWELLLRYCFSRQGKLDLPCLHPQDGLALNLQLPSGQKLYRKYSHTDNGNRRVDTERGTAAEGQRLTYIQNKAISVSEVVTLFHEVSHPSIQSIQRRLQCTIVITIIDIYWFQFLCSCCIELTINDEPRLFWWLSVPKQIYQFEGWPENL